jgi:hypothetical protein
LDEGWDLALKVLLRAIFNQQRHAVDCLAHAAENGFQEP